MPTTPLMSALRASRPDPERSDNTLYVVPPWGVRNPASRWRRVLWALTDLVLFELRVLMMLGFILASGYYALPALYQAKSKAGIDLVPGVHGPDLMPFLDSPTMP